MSRKEFETLISEAVQAIEYGTVHFTLKKTATGITTVDTTRVTSRKLSGNAQALTLIGSMLKLLKESKDSGNLTFTITLKEGESAQLMTHDFNRRNLRGGQYE